MRKEEIAKILTEWWRNEKTCSGKPHCCIEDCDLCTNCFQELCNKFRCEWNLEYGGDRVFVNATEEGTK